ncbi:hypothetical protein LWI29_031168 [Acer saccharum]|uniref:Uncharacterized protein n=1 Tax=Acer saccharum TaxID=4024 RepID=A0AA39VUQ1_ACESA|nr:hypothetical protein LWI29_031168 [Acer saccharum]
MEPTENIVMLYEVSLRSQSDIGSDDEVSCAESWAYALISEYEHFRSGKHDSPYRISIWPPSSVGSNATHVVWSDYISMMKRMADLEEKVNILTMKSATMSPEKEEMLNAVFNRVNALEEELSTTKKFVFPYKSLHCRLPGSQPISILEWLPLVFVLPSLLAISHAHSSTSLTTVPLCDDPTPYAIPPCDLPMSIELSPGRHQCGISYLLDLAATFASIIIPIP